MNDLSSTILANVNSIDSEEWTRQGKSMQFASGKTQRIVGGSIPAMEMTISYIGLNFDQFNALKYAFESNHSNTFLLNGMSTYHDIRSASDGNNAMTYAFKSFNFKVGTSKIYSGSVSLTTSLFFDMTNYQDHHTESSDYSPISSSDLTFTGGLMTTRGVVPYEVAYSYSMNSQASNIGQSIRHIKDKGGLRKVWSLNWLIDETKFGWLLQFYRKRGGIMGSFGVPVAGTIGFETENGTGRTEAIFVNDSFKYNRRTDSFYTVTADIIEVL